jgi:hypothetical protein
MEGTEELFDPHTLLPKDHPLHPGNAKSDQGKSEVPPLPGSPVRVRAGVPPVSSPPTITVSESIRKPKMKVVFLVLIFVLLLAGSIGFYVFKQYGTLTRFQLVSPSAGIGSPAASAISMSDWETYSSPEQGFSIKHPSLVRVSTALVDGMGVVTVLTMTGPEQKDNTDLTDGISLQFVTGSMGEQTLSDYVTNEAKRISQQVTLTKHFHETSVNGVNGFSFTASRTGEVTYIYVPDGGGYLQIADLTKDPAGKGYAKIVSQMLSTFRFTAEGQPIQ